METREGVLRRMLMGQARGHGRIVGGPSDEVKIGAAPAIASRTDPRTIPDRGCVEDQPQQLHQTIVQDQPDATKVLMCCG